jgi:hypothetical protein
VSHPFYVIWTGALNLGDTPGVFNDAAFAGLSITLPVTIGFASGTDSQMLLMTTQVEIFGGRKHPVYWDWTPGTAFPNPVGYIDDTDPIPGRPEYHLLTIPADQAKQGQHSLTVLVNPDIPAGFRDDFVLKRIEADEKAGMKIGWSAA